MADFGRKRIARAIVNLRAQRLDLDRHAERQLDALDVGVEVDGLGQPGQLVRIAMRLRPKNADLVHHLDGDAGRDRRHRRPIYGPAIQRV